jgi:TolB-like protein
MKFNKKIFSSFLIFSFILNSNLYAKKTDEYEKMAKEFASVSSMLTNPKIAVIPFSYIDNKPDIDGAGAIISERLTNRIVQTKSYKVIDRQNLEKILQEQKFQASGLVDSETAKSLGKILGVEAIVTGTMSQMVGNKIEVYAKLIKTETAEILAASSITVPKDWISTQPAVTTSASTTTPQASQPYYAPETTESQNTPARTKGDGFIDLLILKSMSGEMNLKFENSYYGIYFSQLGIKSNYTYAMKSYEIGPADTYSKGSSFGIRFLGFFNYIGFGFEILNYGQAMSNKSSKDSINGTTSGTFSPNSNDFFTIKTIDMNLGLYARFTKKIIQPYLGFNFGFSMNTIDAPYIYAYDDALIWQQGLKTTEYGFTYNILTGLRAMISKNFNVFGEIRTIHNEVKFDRNIKNENDKVTTKNNFIIVGISGKF